jgi:hypothetical protein
MLLADEWWNVKLSYSWVKNNIFLGFLQKISKCNMAGNYILGTGGRVCNKMREFVKLVENMKLSYFPSQNVSVCCNVWLDAVLPSKVEIIFFGHIMI